ncbi:hypothetical protein CBS63078_11287 [Aspergillus niger]|nr:hypothetical protein CBS63078_11287 [Aspergillus niger]
MLNNTNDVSTAIEILIRFIRLHDKVVADNISLLLNPITRGDINGGLLALKKHLCQASDPKGTNEATDHKEETTNEETTNEETTNEETTNEETTNEENYIQKMLQDPNSRLIYESFGHDFERRATEFIATYGANPAHFWNKLPLLSDGHIVTQLLKVLDHHSELSDLTQRLLEIKLHEQVQLLEIALAESDSTLRKVRKGETIRSVALRRVLGHKASRAEEFKVDRGKKLSQFELIDLFRITKPHWRK